MFEKSFEGISSPDESGGGGGGGESTRSLAVILDPNAVVKEKQKHAALAPGKKHGPTSHLPEQVRRHATNYHRPKGDRRLMDHKDAVSVSSVAGGSVVAQLRLRPASHILF